MHPVIDYLTNVLPQRPGFQHNPVQVAYAQALLDGVKAQGQVHFVEGDAGIGKSLAYQLVLADWVAKGKRMGGKQAKHFGGLPYLLDQPGRTLHKPPP